MSQVAMVFDVLSFLAGIGAGVITGALAGVLHGLEKTADIQERLRVASRKVEEMNSRLSTADPMDTKAKADDLQRELDQIHEEIKRMYKRSTR